MKLFNGILNLLFPPKCPFCGTIQDHPGICRSCEAALPWLPDAEAVREVPGGFRCAGSLRYERAVRDVFLRLKFHGASELAEPLGGLLAQCAAEQLSGEFDTVTWVPVSRKRLRKRGYDQSELLARSACRLWDTQPTRLLRKLSNNPAQSSLNDVSARKANVTGVYEAVGDVSGKRILLIDDICTTGSTLSEGARILMDAGAESVVCAAVALTEQEIVHKTVSE